MKKLLVITMLLVAFTSAYAKDPKETVEYWANLELTDENIKLTAAEMNKCWDSPMHLYFKVKEGSKQWNICVAIVAVHGYGGNFEAANTYHKNRKKAATGK